MAYDDSVSRKAVRDRSSISQYSITSYFDNIDKSPEAEIKESIICPICLDSLENLAYSLRTSHVYTCMSGQDGFDEGLASPVISNSDVQSERTDSELPVDRIVASEISETEIKFEINGDKEQAISEHKADKKQVKKQGEKPERKTKRKFEKKTIKASTEYKVKRPVKKAKKEDLPISTAAGQVVKKEATTISTTDGSTTITDGQLEKPRKIPPFFKILDFGHDKKIAVDAFCYGPIPGISSYFLTHFHSDHYGGLAKKWSAGLIYCSEATARLVEYRLRVPSEWLRPLPMNTMVEVEGIQVMLIDANHCPGSAIMLFRYRDYSILHTGDFRASEKQIFLLSEIHPSPLDIIYLDTTYLNAKYCFPSQSSVIEACADYTVSLRDSGGEPPSTRLTLDGFFSFVGLPFRTERKRANPVVFVGSYVIGKERLAIRIAQKLGSKIFPNGSDKSIVLETLEDPELQKLLTDDGLECNVHIVSMRELNPISIAQHWEILRTKFTHLVVFSPTGWNFHASKKQVEESVTPQFGLKELVACRTMTNGGKVHRLRVPYSEHSSFPELRRFIQEVPCRNVIPTVNMETAQQRDMMKHWINQWRKGKARHE